VPFASIFVARAYWEAGEDERFWRILRWLGETVAGRPVPGSSSTAPGRCLLALRSASFRGLAEVVMLLHPSRPRRAAGLERFVVAAALALRC